MKKNVTYYCTIFLLIMMIVPVRMCAQKFQIESKMNYLNEKILLLNNSLSNKIIVYKTMLRVNTDGSPNSYHPFDLRGNKIAINTILNGVSIYRLSDGVRISNPKNRLQFKKKDRQKMTELSYQVFEQYRDSDFTKVPEGYKIVWKNVLVSDRGKPCVFKKGKYRGFFGSRTALTNGLLKSRGECECNNQINPLDIPALVLPGGDNAIKKFGGKLGDHVLIYIPNEKRLVYAVVGDIGPSDNLGEGSIAMNMRVMKETNFPKNRREVNRLSVRDKVMVAVISGSKELKGNDSYSEDRIRSGILDWFARLGYSSEDKIITLLEEAESMLLHDK